MNRKFLPVSPADLKQRGIEQLDIILITGDAYVDHPSFGAAVIGRRLEKAGYAVGIIAQPDWRKKDDFLKLGKPRLFFGITSGNVDSLVANYTANKRPRSDDDSSPGGRPGSRPDRAVVVYANRVREIFGPVPIILGGLEASLRRLAHYDYWDDDVRRAIIFDARGDILVYGMGEKPILEIAEFLKNGGNISELNNVRGTAVIRKNPGDLSGDFLELPSFEEVKSDKEKFNAAFKIIYENQNPFAARTLAQKHGDRYLIQFPPPLPLIPAELDAVYDLPYARDYHPEYKKAGGVPALETIKTSITSHRGCPGECAFCSIYFHQGRLVSSRSPESLVRETEMLVKLSDKKITITNVGGPTANFFGATCVRWPKNGGCPDKKCLYPEKCPSLKMGYSESLKALRKIKARPGVKNVFIGSGFRFDLLADDEAGPYLEEIIENHIGGQMKVAPEHTSPGVLKIMKKSTPEKYLKFVARFEAAKKKTGRNVFLTNYFITGHPGCGLNEALNLALFLAERKMMPEQVQDFIPLPLTVSGAIYHTGLDPFTGETIYVPRTFRERKMQRALAQHRNPINRQLVQEALGQLKAGHLIRKLLG